MRSSSPEADAPGGRAGLGRPLVIRLARLRDVGPVIRLYRGQSQESRSFHHPYPVDRPRLTMLFTWMVVSGHLSRLFLRTVPGLGFVLLVAESGERRAPIAYGTIRFVRSATGEVWARFGFLVGESYRGEGIGTELAIALWERALALGVRRGGGTIEAKNTRSRSIIEGAGFRLAPTDEEDRYRPAAENLAGIADLTEALERLRARRDAATDRPG